MYGHRQEIIEIKLIDTINPKSVKYIELTTGKDTKYGIK